MTFVPVPEVGAGHFEPGQNLANWVDKHYGSPAESVGERTVQKG